jgi:hypothetical protein
LDKRRTYFAWYPSSGSLIDHESRGQLALKSLYDFWAGCPVGGEGGEIASVSDNTLTLTTPLHWTFKTAQSAQVSRVAAAATKWAGIESLLVQGGRPGGYPGQNAGGIDVSNAAYSWVKDVQVDGTTACPSAWSRGRASGFKATSTP